MAIPSSKFCVFLLFVCVYTSVARPNNFGSVGKQDENENGPDVAAELMDQVNPNADSVRTLFKRSKDKDDEDSTLLDEEKKEDRSSPKKNSSHGDKKHVIDAIHLGPYHGGHSWGTMNVWPGVTWPWSSAWGRGWGMGHPGNHGWIGYKSKVPKGRGKSDKKSKTSTEGTGAHADKRWWPGNMGGWGGWGWGNWGYPGWGWGVGHGPFPGGFGWGHGFYRSDVPNEEANAYRRSSVSGSKASKRWWPGNMGGWGGWGWGNWGYPGWGWGVGHGAGSWGHPGYRSNIPKDNKEEKSKGKSSKRFLPLPGMANRPWYGGWHGFDINPGYDYPGYGYPGYGHGGFFHGYGYPGNVFDGYLYNSIGRGIGFGGWGYPGDYLGYGHGHGHEFGYGGYGHGFGYGAGFGFGGFAPGFGRGLGFGYGGYGPGFGHGHGFLRSHVHKSTSKNKTQNKAQRRHHVTYYHPGHYGWGGTVYRGSGAGGVLPLMGSFGPFGHALSPLGPYGAGVWGPFYHKSHIPRGDDKESERAQSRQVIGYNPGCYGWGGTVYPGCGYLGGFGWGWPCGVPCGGCGACACKDKTPHVQKGKDVSATTRQQIESPISMSQQENGDQPGEGIPEEKQSIGSFGGGSLYGDNMGGLGQGYPGSLGFQAGASDQPGGFGGFGGMGQGIAPMAEMSQGFHSSNMDNFPSEDAAPGAMEQGEQPEGDMGVAFNSMPMSEEQQAMQEGPQGQLGQEGESSMFTGGEQGEQQQEYGPSQDSNNEGSSKRENIPIERTRQKKQAVAYPYRAYGAGVDPLAAGYPTMLSPYSHLFATPHYMGYPLTNGLAPLAQYALPHIDSHPSHSIHVGSPSVNVDVQTTREHVAQNPEKKKNKSRLQNLVKETIARFEKTRKKHTEDEERSRSKRQLSPLFTPVSGQQMAMPPVRYPVPSHLIRPLGADFAWPSRRSPQPLAPSPAWAYSRSDTARRVVPASQGVGPSPALLRQLQTVAGISMPLTSRPGMGIVGMQKRSRIPKRTKQDVHKHKQPTKNQKRQFLATPFLGAAPAVVPSFPTTALHPVAASPLLPVAFPASTGPLMPLHALGALPAPAYAPLHQAYPGPGVLPAGGGVFPTLSGLVPLTALPAARGVVPRFSPPFVPGPFPGLTARLQAPFQGSGPLPVPFSLPQAPAAASAAAVQREGTPQSQERFAGPNSFGVPEPPVNYNNNEAVASSEAPLVVGGAPGGQREFSPMVQGEQQGAFANFNQRTPEMFGSQMNFQPGLLGAKKSQVPKTKQSGKNIKHVRGKAS